MSVRILVGDVRDRLKDLPDESVHCVVTSPPYFGLRDYGHPGQIGLEPTPAEFVRTMVEVFREVRRVLRPDGTFWLNLGDSYAQGGGGGASSKSTLKNDGRPVYGARAQELALNERAFSRKAPPGLKPKDLIGIPWRVAFALQEDGWYLRSDIIWHKPNPMPESVTDRPTSAHEHIFLLAKSERYFYDHEAVKEPAICGANGSEFHTGKTGEHQLGRAQKVRPSKPKGSFAAKGEPLPGQLPFRAVTEMRNLRNVWSVPTVPFNEAHFATFPPALVEPCIKAGCPHGGTVLDPFGGAGTSGLVADRLGRNAILIELNPDYAAMAERRIRNEQPMFADVQLDIRPQLEAAE